MIRIISILIVILLLPIPILAESPGSPITVKMNISYLPSLNAPTDVDIIVNSIIDAPDTTVNLILPEGVTLVNEKSTWISDLKANKSQKFSAKIKITKNGLHEIKASVNKDLDKNNTLGDIDAIYVTMENTSHISSPIPNSIIKRGIGKNIPKDIKIISDDGDDDKQKRITKIDSNIKPPGKNQISNLSAKNNINNLAGTITVAGRFGYYTNLTDYRNISNTFVWAKDFLVELVDRNDRHLGWGWTDQNGYFESTIENPGSAGVRVWWRTYDTEGPDELMVVPPGSDGNWDETYIVQSAIFELSDGFHNIGNWELAQGDSFEGAYWIKEDLTKAWKALWNIKQSAPGRGVAEWSFTNTDGAWYDHGGHIVLRGIDRKSSDTVIHEYGHNVQWNVYGNWLPDTPNCNPHWINGVSSYGCAWVEGWADYLPLYVNGNALFTGPSGGGLNMESPSWSDTWWQQGPQVEGRVAMALWDMHDNVIDGVDRTSNGMFLIWDTLLNINSDTYGEFYGDTRPKYVSNWAPFNIKGVSYQNTIDYDTAPNVPRNPDPADGSVNQYPTSLHWDYGGYWSDPDADETKNYVYMSWDPVRVITFDPSAIVCSDTTSTYCGITPAYSVLYYWRVLTTDGLKTSGSPIWTFSTSTPPPSIEINVPNGGETWVRGMKNTIKWTSTGNSGSYVNIELRKSYTNTFVGTIASNTPNDGSYDWTISPTRTLGSDYKIRIVSEKYYGDMSADYFRIGGINVISPNGGGIWIRGTKNTIKWNSLGYPGSYVRIELLKSGVLVGTISSSTSNDGSYDWTISPTRTLGSDYKIRITSIDNPAYKDTSNNNFIIGGINVNSPNGGENWVRGATYAIKWNSLGNPGTSVKIQLFKNNIYWTPITWDTPNDGLFDWKVPSGTTPATDYKIRITSNSNSAYKDISNNNFRIY